jgi:hypothetical protein
LKEFQLKQRFFILVLIDTFTDFVYAAIGEKLMDLGIIGEMKQKKKPYD